MTRTVGGDLRALFEPRSVAVVGASRDPKIYGYLVPRDLLGAGYASDLHLVNPRGGAAFDRSFHESLMAIGDAPDLVVSVVPPARTEDVIENCVRVGAKAVVLLAAGFAESGVAGASLEAAIVRRAAAGGVRVLGPNCLGLFNASCGVNLMTNADIAIGSIALVSQSGGLAEMFFHEARRLGGGVSFCASIGNQADVRVQEAIAYAAEHEEIDVIAVYIEAARDGEELLDVVTSASARKPVVVLKGGRSEAGARSAASHTASIAGRANLYDALLARAGAVVVERLSDFYPVSLALSWCPPLRERRIALLGGGGGTATVMADTAERIGLGVPALSPPTQATLRNMLLPTSNVSNQVEFAGATEESFAVYEACAKTLLDADDIDAVVLFGSFGGFRLELETKSQSYRATARRFGELSRDADKPFLVQSYFVGGDLPALNVLREQRIPAFASPETTLRCVAALAQAARLPEVARVARLEAEPRDEVRMLDFDRARDLFASAGLEVVDSVLVHDWAKTLEAANTIGYPIVLKIRQPHLVHKTDAGAVATQLCNESELEAAARRLLALARSHDRNGEGVALGVSPMVRDGIEAVVGAIRDPAFGALVMVGTGGVHLEIHADIVFAAGRVDDAEA